MTGGKGEIKMNYTSAVDPKNVKYYYIRDFHNNPLITVCIIKGEDGTFSRGISFCSLLDNPCKKTGRSKAYRQALKAFFSRQSVGLLELNLFANEVARLTDEFYKIDFWTRYRAKSMFNIVPTDFERRLFIPREMNYN